MQYILQLGLCSLCPTEEGGIGCLCSMVCACPLSFFKEKPEDEKAVVTSNVVTS